MKVEIRIEGNPEQIARFLREMAGEQIVDLAKTEENKFFSFPIEELEFGVRTYNCLKRVGIETIGEVVSKTETELAAIPLFNKKSIKEVKEALAAYGLVLRNEDK
ncbi:MAG: hypothetical protein HYW00_00325 [Candidatus Colwellbacteria bacterium]|nr:hypothetical protein [Candidatus Colwellbacteria bacterium]